MKQKLLLLVISFMMALSVPLSAADITVDGIKYSTNNGRTAQVIGCTITGDLIIPEIITFNGNTFSVTSIGDRAFYDSYSLTSINIPNSVTSIGDYAFFNCFELVSITVEGGNSVYDSRNNCNAIIETGTNILIAGCKKTVIPNTVTSIGSSAFSDCSKLTSITIPNSVTSIGYSAFLGCASLTSVTIPNSVTSIGDCAFANCTSFTSVTIPNSLTIIPGQVFYGCINLTSLTIPNSVTKIEKYAFDACGGLLSITCLADTPPTAYANTFESVDKTLCTLYVKKNTVSLYASSVGWSDFTNIVEIDDENMDINPIQADPESEMVYDLSGNRVLEKQKGRAYIRNSKKILVK